MSKSQSKIFISFLAVESILYVIFIVFDFLNPSISQRIKLSSIFLCFAICFIFWVFSKNKKQTLLLVSASLFTCLSDYLLLIEKDSNLFTIGVFTFFIVQILYFAYHSKNLTSKNLVISLACRLFVVFLICLVATAIKLDALTTLSLCYFSLLLGNFINSLLLVKNNKKYIIISAGFLLFILCDICVGMNNINIDNAALKNFATYGMWIFYLPSQVILASTIYFLE